MAAGKLAPQDGHLHGMADVDAGAVEEHSEKNAFMRWWSGVKASKTGQAIAGNSAFKHVTYVSGIRPCFACALCTLQWPARGSKAACWKPLTATPWVHAGHELQGP